MLVLSARKKICAFLLGTRRGNGTHKVQKCAFCAWQSDGGGAPAACENTDTLLKSVQSKQAAGGVLVCWEQSDGKIPHLIRANRACEWLEQVLVAKISIWIDPFGEQARCAVPFDRPPGGGFVFQPKMRQPGFLLRVVVTEFG